MHDRYIVVWRMIDNVAIDNTPFPNAAVRWASLGCCSGEGVAGSNCRESMGEKNVHLNYLGRGLARAYTDAERLPDGLSAG